MNARIWISNDGRLSVGVFFSEVFRYWLMVGCWSCEFPDSRIKNKIQSLECICEKRISINQQPTLFGSQWGLSMSYEQGKRLRFAIIDFSARHLAYLAIILIL